MYVGNFKLSGSLTKFPHLSRPFSGTGIMHLRIATCWLQTNGDSGSPGWRRANSELRMVVDSRRK